MHTDDTQSIIDGCLRGEDRWQRALYNKYSPRIYALCLRYAYDSEVAKDIMIEGFLKVYNSIGQYRGEGPFEAWMQRIFIFTAYHYYRQYKRKEVSLSDNESTDFVAPTVHPEDQIDTRNALNIALARLDKEDRMVFNMVAVEGYKFREVAQIADMPESSAKTRFYRARRLMQETLEKIGITTTEKRTAQSTPNEATHAIEATTL